MLTGTRPSWHNFAFFTCLLDRGRFRELAAKTAKPVYSAEQAALEQLGMAEAEHFVRLGQEHLNAIRTEFNKILQQEKV